MERRQDAKVTKLRSLLEPPREADERARAVIGAAIEVHRHLGPGHIERMYEQALLIELRLRGIPFDNQAPASLSYKGVALGEFRLDLVVDDLLVVETKAIESISSVHVKQVLSYLTVTGLPLGLLLNFNVPMMQQGIRRVVNRG